MRREGNPLYVRWASMKSIWERNRSSSAWCATWKPANPCGSARKRKKETLDGFFQTELSAQQRRGIQAACLDMWKPYRLSIEQWAPNCQIVYDKFHIMQHANKAVDEVRRAEFVAGRVEG